MCVTHQDRGQYDITAWYFAVDISNRHFLQVRDNWRQHYTLASVMFEDTIFTAKKLRGRRKKIHDHLEKNKYLELNIKRVQTTQYIQMKTPY